MGGPPDRLAAAFAYGDGGIPLSSMLRRAAFAGIVAVGALAVAAPAAMADNPPGLLGYEGQPGNQGGPQHHP